MAAYSFHVGEEIQGAKGKYRILEKMQGGARATVICLVENINNREQAILKLNSHVDEAEIVSFIREVYKDQGKTPPVVEILDKLEIPGLYGHIEKIAEGKSCKDYQPTELQSLQIALEIASLLHICASNKVAYLDIKPLSHIFWREKENESSSLIVNMIDWNNARFEAEAHILREDLVAFCNYLPELFTGKEIETLKLHPLYWKFDQGQNSSLPVRYSTWILLANLSLDWAGPTIRELDSILRMSGIKLTLENIVAAWAAVIKHIMAAIRCYQNPDSPVFDLYDNSGMGLDTNQSSQLILQAIKAKGSPAPDLIEMMEKTAAQFAGELKARKEIIKVTSSGYEPVIRSIRMLCPSNQQYAILLSAFKIWKNAAYISSSEVDEDWQKLIQAIIGADFELWARIKATKFASMKAKVEARLKQDPSTDTSTYGSPRWAEKLDDLGGELDVWMVLQTGSNEEVRDLPASHPYVKIRLSEIEHESEKLTELEKDIQALSLAYQNADFNKIFALVPQMMALGDLLSGKQREQLLGYQHAAGIFQSLDDAQKSWQEDDIERGIKLIIALPQPQHDIAQKHYLGEFEQKKQTIQYLKTKTKELEHIAASSFPDLNWTQCHAARETPEYQRLIIAFKEWAEKCKTWLQTKVSAIEADEWSLDTGLVLGTMADVDRLLELAHPLELKEIETFAENLKTFLEKKKGSIERRIETFQKYYFVLLNAQSGTIDTLNKDSLAGLPEEVRALVDSDAVKNVVKSHTQIDDIHNSIAALVEEDGQIAIIREGLDENINNSREILDQFAKEDGPIVAIRTGLDKTRAVIRDGLDKTRETSTEILDQFTKEDGPIAEIRDSLHETRNTSEIILGQFTKKDGSIAAIHANLDKTRDISAEILGKFTKKDSPIAEIRGSLDETRYTSTEILDQFAKEDGPIVAIRTGLDKTRAVIRDGLDKTRETSTEILDQFTKEDGPIAEIHASLKKNSELTQKILEKLNIEEEIGNEVSNKTAATGELTEPTVADPVPTNETQKLNQSLDQHNSIEQSPTGTPEISKAEHKPQPRNMRRSFANAIAVPIRLLRILVPAFTRMTQVLVPLVLILFVIYISLIQASMILPGKTENSNQADLAKIQSDIADVKFLLASNNPESVVTPSVSVTPTNVSQNVSTPGVAQETPQPTITITPGITLPSGIGKDIPNIYKLIFLKAKAHAPLLKLTKDSTDGFVRTDSVTNLLLYQIQGESNDGKVGLLGLVKDQEITGDTIQKTGSIYSTDNPAIILLVAQQSFNVKTILPDLINAGIKYRLVWVEGWYMEPTQ